MKTGYTVIEDNIKFLKKICDKVIYVGAKKHRIQEFSDFINNNLDAELYTYSFEDLGLTLRQTIPAFELLRSNEQTLCFLEKGAGEILSDTTYNSLLLELGKSENKLLTERKRAAVGPIGRPKINQEVIDKIVKLHETEKRSIREIAYICDVSVGTVHKYVLKSKQTQQTSNEV